MWTEAQWARKSLASLIVQSLNLVQSRRSVWMNYYLSSTSKDSTTAIDGETSLKLQSNYV